MCASGPASAALAWCGRKVGGLGARYGAVIRFLAEVSGRYLMDIRQTLAHMNNGLQLASDSALGWGAIQPAFHAAVPSAATRALFLAAWM
jgi:hypothetical protein